MMMIMMIMKIIKIKIMRKMVEMMVMATFMMVKSLTFDHGTLEIRLIIACQPCVRTTHR